MKKIVAILACFVLAFSLTNCAVKQEKIDNDIKNNKDDNQNVTQNEVEVIEDVEYELTLYFPDNDALFLHPEARVVTIRSNESVEMRLIDELIKGPVTDNRWAAVEGEGLINSIVTDETGLCTIDLKSDFEILNSGGTTREMFVFGSIVNSLCELEHINSVKFNVEGDTAYEYGGHSVLDTIFYPNSNIVEK